MDRAPGEALPGGPVRLLFVGAGDAAEAWSAALEEDGLECRIAHGREAGAVRERLLDPLDGIVAWDDEAGESSAAVVAAASASGPEVPVLAVPHRSAPDGAVRALAAGAAGVVDRRHSERLPAAVRGILRRTALETREALAGRIAHELNNTLAPVPLATQLLGRSLGRPEASGTQKSHLDAIDQATRASMQSVRQLSELLVARDHEPLRVQAKHPLAIAAQHWRDSSHGVGRVLVEYPPDLPAVRVVVPRLLQVLGCLARRGLDRSAGGELLFLGREDGGGSVELSVGCGPPGSAAAAARPDPGTRDAVPVGAEDGLEEVLRAVEEGGGGLLRVEVRGGWKGFAVVLPESPEPGRPGRRSP